MIERVNEAVKFIKSQTKITPKVGIVLGSGLGIFTDKMDDTVSIPYEDIPGFHKTTVVGHEGELVIGNISGISVCALRGRFHTYEGHSLEDVVMPVRVLGKLGISHLILTNASGGINDGYIPGDLVCITDHINLTGRNPLIGKNEEDFGPRFPDMTETYCPEFREIVFNAAQKLDIDLKAGVYAGVLGPTYETPAEINMLKIIGADLVGMSTVPEAIAANHMGLKIAGLACVTNYAAGISKEKLKHEDVKDVANTAIKKFSDLITELIKQIG